MRRIIAIAALIALCSCDASEDYRASYVEGYLSCDMKNPVAQDRGNDPILHINLAGHKFVASAYSAGWSDAFAKQSPKYSYSRINLDRRETVEGAAAEIMELVNELKRVKAEEPELGVRLDAFRKIVGAKIGSLEARTDLTPKQKLQLAMVYLLCSEKAHNVQDDK